jgi:hypothetical protein
MRAARCRIRVNGQEVDIGGITELVRLVRIGRIGPATEIWDESTASWTVVGQLDGITETGDPWSAWAEDESSEPPFEAPVDPPPPVVEPVIEPPVVAQAIEPVVPVVAQAIEPVVPVVPVEETTAPPLVEDDEDLVPTTGEVIAFPTERVDFPRRRTQGPHALAERPVALPQQRPRPEPPRVRLSIVLGTSIIGFLGLGWWVWYVNTASESLPPPALLEPVHVPGAVEDAREPPPSPAQAQLRVVEQELVERLPQTTRTIADESDLEMALNTELASLGVDVIEADAKVFSWTLSDGVDGAGAARVPQVVEFSVRVRPATGSQLSDREQGAIAIVVGRYIAAYDLVVTQFDVVVESPDALPRTVPTDAMRAQRLAEGQIDLAAYLRVP